MKKVLIVISIMLLLCSCSDSRTSNPPAFDWGSLESADTIHTPDDTNHIDDYPELTTEQAVTVKKEITDLFEKAGYGTPTIDFRCNETYIYHLVAETDKIRCVYRYSTKADKYFQESVEENGEVELLYMITELDVIKSYGTLGMDIPTWIDMSQYNDIIKNDYIKEY